VILARYARDSRAKFASRALLSANVNHFAIVAEEPKIFSGISIENIWRFVGSARVVILGYFCYRHRLKFTSRVIYAEFNPELEPLSAK